MSKEARVASDIFRTASQNHRTAGDSGVKPFSYRACLSQSSTSMLSAPHTMSSISFTVISSAILCTSSSGTTRIKPFRKHSTCRAMPLMRTWLSSRWTSSSLFSSVTDILSPSAFNSVCWTSSGQCDSFTAKTLGKWLCSNTSSRVSPMDLYEPSRMYRSFVCSVLSTDSRSGSRSCASVFRPKTDLRKLWPKCTGIVSL
mmetsp:Transcript_10005/g.25847  ORF Transcript_10005/g.25847 Transcript_10005/m.25847 type:complete len:200 (+) Transcript_10005:1-600(+)